MKKITDKKKWDDILLEIGCFDTYHTYDYHKVHAVIDGGIPVMFVNRNGVDIIAVTLLERSIGTDKIDFTSVYGYTGPISNTLDKSKFLNLYNDLIGALSYSPNYISLFSRVNSLTVLDSALSAIFQHSGHTVTIDLNLPNEDQVSGYRKKTRYDIKKLKKIGFSCNFVDSGEGIDSFIEIYNAAMKSIGADEYYFFNKSYYVDLFSNDLAEVKMVRCDLDGQAACVGIFFFCNNIVQYHLGANAKNFLEFSPTKLMIDFVRNYSANTGFEVFHLGGGLSGGDDNLFKFKKGFSNKINKFYLMKEILNKEEYNHLSKGKNNSSYFPLYRS